MSHSLTFGICIIWRCAVAATVVLLTVEQFRLLFLSVNTEPDPNTVSTLKNSNRITIPLDIAAVASTSSQYLQ
eukprot:6200497-Pleurochrysis_carterae.AAC.1